jgi:hypothetical protein
MKTQYTNGKIWGTILSVVAVGTAIAIMRNPERAKRKGKELLNQGAKITQHLNLGFLKNLSRLVGLGTDKISGSDRNKSTSSATSTAN